MSMFSSRQKRIIGAFGGAFLVACGVGISLASSHSSRPTPTSLPSFPACVSVSSATCADGTIPLKLSVAAQVQAMEPISRSKPSPALSRGISNSVTLWDTRTTITADGSFSQKTVRLANPDFIFQRGPTVSDTVYVPQLREPASKTKLTVDALTVVYGPSYAVATTIPAQLQNGGYATVITQSALNFSNVVVSSGPNISNGIVITAQLPALDKAEVVMACKGALEPSALGHSGCVYASSVNYDGRYHLRLFIPPKAISKNDGGRPQLFTLSAPLFPAADNCLDRRGSIEVDGGRGAPFSPDVTAGTTQTLTTIGCFDSHAVDPSLAFYVSENSHVLYP